MAFSSKPTGILSYNMIDGSGSRAALRLHFPIATTVAAVFTAADALMPLIVAISDCTVLGYTVGYDSTDNNPTAPSNDGRVEDKGMFVFRLANQLTSRLEVPGIKNSTLIDTGSIDVTNADVAAFLGAVVNSPSIFKGIDGSDITAVRSAYQRFRRSTKAQLPSDRSKFGGA